MTKELTPEQAVIGATLISRGKATALLSLEGTDFTDTRHRVIASVLRDMMRRDIPIDQMTVATELEAIGKLSTPGGAGGRMYLFDLTALEIVPANADHYADQVRAATRLRLFRDANRTMADKCQLEDAGSHLDELIRTHRQALDAIPAPLGTGDTDDSRDTVGVMLSEADEETDWLIPGLLAREERAVVVAGEGVAKTTLLRQFAVCMAGGLNPWNGQRVTGGLRVLFIDTENSRGQSRRAYRWIAGRCYRPTMDRNWKNNIIHKTRNDGVNLLGKDEPWFRDLADRVSPDVIILSPAYKLMRGDPKEDRDVLGLLDVIDRVRVQHRAAILIETHAPHGTFMSRDMRPFGSSVWLRWPEVGFGYQRDRAIPEDEQPRKPEFLESVDWRGAREPRDWPDRICYGGPKELPWVPNNEWWAPSVDANYQIPEGEAA
jgi:replicative DNA helicase